MRAGLLIGQATEVVPYERLLYSSTAVSYMENVHWGSSTYVEDNHLQGIGYNAMGMLDSPAAWCAASNDLYQWIRMDAGQVKVINGVVTQGNSPMINDMLPWSGGNPLLWDQYVTSYFIETSSDGNTWTTVTTPTVICVCLCICTLSLSLSHSNSTTTTSTAPQVVCGCLDGGM
jgi:hypothetical protein